MVLFGVFIARPSSMLLAGQVTESFGKSTDGGTVRKAVIFHAKDGRLSVATPAEKAMVRVGSAGKNQLKASNIDDAEFCEPVASVLTPLPRGRCRPICTEMLW